MVNPDAGSGFGEPPLEKLKEELPGAEFIETSEAISIEEALEKAAASGRAIGICGGDGSVNAAARVAYENEKPLVVIPGGTLNHFAKDLGIESVDDAIGAVRDGEPVAVDVATIDGRPFVNTASFGSYVDLVDARERIERSVGKWPAVFLALFRVLTRAEPVNVEVDGELKRVWMAFIGNCHYHPHGFAPSWRRRLDDGLIDIRFVSAEKPFARARLLWSVLTGTLARSSVYESKVTEEPVEVRSLDPDMRLARDGETFSSSGAFTIEKAERRIVVLVPREEE